MSANPIPDGFNTVSAYLIVPNSVEALEFYAKAFGAEAGVRMTGPGGDQTTMHAEMRIGNSMVMLTDENPMWNLKGPATLGGAAVTLHLYVEDADALYQRAVDAGCSPTFPIDDVFWGDRYGKVEDPYGHGWGIATHKIDLTPEELSQRQQEWLANMAQAQAEGQPE